MSRTLHEVVVSIAAQLMIADQRSAVDVSNAVLADLADFLGLDVAFLRHNDHEIRATTLIAQWPVREFVPDPDPIGVVYFADADPEFAATEHLKEPAVVRPDSSSEEYQRRIEEGTAVPQISLAVVPLLSDEITTGTLGFIKYGDREWLPAELDALMIIAALFAQLQARVAALDRLHYLAERDELTGLWNRRYLIDHLVDRMRTGRAGPVAVLYIDLDRLKGINDLHGHLAGDRFLAAFAERLRDLVDDTAAVARLGGDEFVVVLRDPVTVEGAQQLAERLHEQLRQRVTIGGERIGRTVSVAAALGIPGSHTASDLLGYADQALREAKNNGGDRVAVFSQDLGLRNDLRNDVELHLQGGIENNALVVHYLPEVNLRTHEVIAAEALVRWNHPNRGMLYPDSFIPIAESTGLAVELGRLVLRTACTHLQRWRSMGLATDLMLRVNVSPAQLVAAGFAQDVAEIVASSGIDVGSICLEITEGLLFKDIETVRANVAALKQVGVQVAVDDFGTGYSAFSRLKALPVDAVKIDKSFVQNLGSDVDDLAIVRTIIALADAFGIDVIAEGVETVLAAETLLRLGCRRAQGYLFSRPIDDMAMQNLLKNPRLPVPRNDSTFQPVGVRQHGTLE